VKGEKESEEERGGGQLKRTSFCIFLHKRRTPMNEAMPALMLHSMSVQL
jgi:hypothetical protein